ncbi:hypothetical protein BKA61DRAFT_583080 [Leptodontidium sp. MPI-SDFR-AT-0119]|nr:hypothetical protein BKA61DRAFT_583080 [Leptodontidium sp. MPI-SDFR-AT-0119]
MDPPWIQNEAAKEAARRQEEILARLRNDLKNNRLAIITGAGVTLNVTADTSGKPLSRITWTGLMRNGLDYLVNEGYVDRSNRRTSRAYEALEDPEIDGLLDAANILSSQMKQQGQFPTWLESVFGSLSQEVRHPDLLDMLKALHERGAILLTTNYDDVLEKYCGLQRVGRSNQDDVSRFQRGDLNGVFHIHGSYCDPHEVVLDTTDYYDVKHLDGVQDVLKTFLQYKTILFVGCGSGLEDPNFDALLRWASERHKNISNRHCLLIRDDDSVKYKPLVRVKYGPRYEDLVVYLKRLLDDQTEKQSPVPPVGLDLARASLKPLRVLPFGRNKDFVGRQSHLDRLITILHAEDTEEDCQRVALDRASSALSEWLPFSTLGAILFTTRDREAATRYAGLNVIVVGEMDDKEARKLLQRSLQQKQLINDDSGITKLLELLVNLPLAIMQAAAYLNTKVSTINEYLRIYEESSENVIKLLSKDFGDVRRYPGIKNLVATTWLISFEQIQDRNPLATDYMAFISCIKEQDIPRDLLPPASEFDKTEALGILKAFGFIQDRYAEAEAIYRQALQLNEIVLGKEHPDTLGSMIGLAASLHSQGKHTMAEAIYRQTLQLNETVLGKEHPDTLGSMMGLAVSLRNLGKYAEAEAMYRQTLQLQETVLGKDHPETLRTIMNLAVSLRKQGKYAEAEAMYRQTLQLQETVLGKEHPETLTNRMNLAVSLDSQGKYAEAEAMYRQTLQLQETVLGKEHPETLRTIMNLAALLHSQGKYAEAEAMYRQTLQLQETVLGKEHPETLRTIMNLAVSLYSQGKYAEAETMYRQTLQLREIVLGKEHPDTLMTIMNLALSLDSQGKYTEAEAMYRQTLQLQEIVLGKEHPDTLRTIMNLAVSLHRQGKYAEAEAMYKQTLQLQETMLGKEHPNTLKSRKNLVVLLRKQGKYAEAETYAPAAVG